jgi:hypothetical protein
MTYEEQEKWENVQYRMDAEGFHYCFESYSHWDDIKDPEFHKLRKDYLAAAAKLEAYVNSKCEEDNEE